MSPGQVTDPGDLVVFENSYLGLAGAVAVGTPASIGGGG